MNALVASDLHLFSRRSRFAELEDDFFAAAKESEILVLNGDVFDFKWSSLGSLDASITAAAAWLQSLLEQAPDTRLHYVLGNHDALAPFAAELTVLAAAQPRFHWHPSHVQFGSVLFHHGDLLLQADSARHWQRSLHDAVAIKGEFRNVVYDATVGSRLHRAPELLNQPSRVARRVVAALRASKDPQHAAITDLFVGHTHLGFDKVTVDGISVHNTGCAIKHLCFSPQRLTLPTTTLAV